MFGRWFKSIFIGFFVLAVVFNGLFQVLDLNEYKENKELLNKYVKPFIGTAYAASANETELPCWPHENSDLYPDPAIVYGKLPNGFRYVLMKNHEPKKRVSMHLNIQTGSMNEADHEQGMAHFLEHMLFNGSTHFKPGELVKYFQSIGMQFGPDQLFEFVRDLDYLVSDGGASPRYRVSTTSSTTWPSSIPTR